MSEFARTTHVRGDQNIVGNNNTQENYENSGSGTFIAKAELVTVNHIGPSEEAGLFKKCMNELPLTNPNVDLTTTRANKDRRLPGTCEWILNRPEYTRWFNGEGPQNLLLFGAPGIGKTMLSMFLVDTLKEQLKERNQMLAYFFCDDKDARRRTDTAILRGLLYQLLNDGLSKHILAPYSRFGKSLFKQFDELSQVFSAVLDNVANGPVYILIDAMDECGAVSLGRIMKLLGDLIARKANVKVLVTSRPHRTVEDCFTRCLQIDSERVKNDVDEYIKSKVKDLAKREHYSANLRERVLSALQEKSDGTFLWTSLILEHISDGSSDESVVLGMLEILPRNLNGVYKRILTQIERKHSKEAKFVFGLLVAARRPLTVHEVDVAYYIWTNKTSRHIVSGEIRKEMYKSCGALVYLDRANNTVNFSHQSAKDYLMNSDNQFALTIFLVLLAATALWISLTVKHLNGFFYSEVALLVMMGFFTYVWPTSTFAEACRGIIDADFIGYRYRVLLDQSNLDLFKICWQYLVMVLQSESSQPHDEAGFRKALEKNKQFPYATEEWLEHALASSPASVSQVAWIRGDLEKFPILREEWFLATARQGHSIVMQLLIEKGADILTKNEDGLLAIDMATENEHWDIVQTLLDKCPGLIPRKFQMTVEEEAKSSADNWISNYKLVAKWHENFADSRDDRIFLAVAWGVRMSIIAMVWWMVFAPSKFLSYTMRRSGPWLVSFFYDLNLDQYPTQTWRALTITQITALSISFFPSFMFLSIHRWWGQYILFRLHERVQREGWLTSVVGVFNTIWQFVTSGILLLALDEEFDFLAKLLLRTAVKLDVRDDDGWTPLMRAIQNKNCAMSRLLLEKGANPNFKRSDGIPPICLAAKKGNVEIVKLLIDTGQVDPDSRDFRKCTPMIWAAWEGRESVVRLLLDCKGVDINLIDIDGDCALGSAATRGHDEVIKLLLATDKANLNIKNKENDTPLIKALIRKRETTAKLLLDTNKVDISISGGQGRTALSYAAQNGYDEIVKLLLQYPEVDVNSKSSRGKTALLYAAEKGHVVIVGFLLGFAGIEVNAKSNLGQTAFILAAQGGYEAIVELLIAYPEVEVDSRTNSDWTAFLHAASGGHESVVKLLLDNPKVDIDSKNSLGRTPLACAARGGHETIVKLLIDSSKVNINSKTSDDWTPIFFAVWKGHETIVKLLIECDKADVDSKSKVDRTPLSYAADKGHEGIVKLLLEIKEVDVNSRSKTMGRSPLFYAIKAKHGRVADMLRDAGATITEEEEKSAEEAAEEDTESWDLDHE